VDKDGVRQELFQILFGGRCLALQKDSCRAISSGRRVMNPIIIGDWAQWRLVRRRWSITVLLRRAPMDRPIATSHSHSGCGVRPADRQFRHNHASGPPMSGIGKFLLQFVVGPCPTNQCCISGTAKKFFIGRHGGGNMVGPIEIEALGFHGATASFPGPFAAPKVLRIKIAIKVAQRQRPSRTFG